MSPKRNHVAWHICPACGAIFDGALNVDGDQPPKEGDPTICIECGAVSVFDQADVGGLRLATYDDAAIWGSETNMIIARAQRAIIERLKRQN